MTKIICCAAIFILVFLTLSCKEIQGPVGPAGPAGSGDESLTDPSIMPKVINTYPPANSVGPYDPYFTNQLQIRFNKIMDRTLLRRAIKLTSPGTTVRIDTTFVYSVGGDLFFAYAIDSLSFSYQWKIGKTYTVSIDSSVKDINGNALSPSYSMTFKPEPYFRIRSISPANGATNVYSSAQISITFNGAVDTSIFSSIHLTPNVPGTWVEYCCGDSTIIYYFSSTTLAANTLYTVTIITTAHDKDGHYLPQQYVSTFTTTPFRVSYTNPQNGSTNVSLSNDIVIQFTSSVDTGSILSAFKINPAITGYFNYNEGDSYFSVYPNGGFLPDTLYTVTIDTSMRSKDGTKLLLPYVFSFRTEPFSVTYTYPSNGSTGVSRSLGSIEVDFNATIDTSSIRSAFNLPGVSGSFYFYDGGEFFLFYPTNLPLSANTTYTATILTAMRSKSGAYLKIPYTFSFTTGN